MTTTKRVIIVTELSESLECRVDCSTPNDNDYNTLKLLQAALLPGELDKFSKRLLQAKTSGKFVMVGVEFTNGHARRIIYNESEILDRE